MGYLENEVADGVSPPSLSPPVRYQSSCIDKYLTESTLYPPTLSAATCNRRHASFRIWRVIDGPIDGLEGRAAMARQMKILTPLGVQREKKPGLYHDGGGLYLRVKEGGAKSWFYRFMIAGKRRDMGLGSLDTMSLTKARDAATEARKAVAAGTDPIEARNAAEAAARAAAGKIMTFENCAKAYISAMAPGWKNVKHASQWPATMETYVYPTLGKLPVNEVDTGLVMKVLEPIWTSKTETASRVRGRIEAVLTWASARGHRQGPNPAIWRGHLEALLPAKGKIAQVRHHPSLPYHQMGDFMLALRRLTSISARALEFGILTAARSGEVRGATWNEIDFERGVWTVPGGRMKAGAEHRVPLSTAAADVLKAMESLRQNDLVFPGAKHNQPLSDMALSEVCRGLGFKDDNGRIVAPHGFRASFRSWGGEVTAYSHETLEQALAHTISDAVVRAYARGDLFQKRTRLMDEWAAFIAKPSTSIGSIIAIRG